MNEVLTYIIILNFNSSSETIALFQNLKAIGLKAEVLVIDNCSSKEDQERLINELPLEDIIFNKKNLGYAGGNNIGIEIALKANADYIWILNPDIRIEESTLPKLIQTLEGDETLAAVGPRIIKRNNPDIIFTDGEILVMDEKCSTIQKNHNLLIVDAPAKIDYGVDYIDGSSILLNRKAILDIGKLPEEYFLYFEETDWCSNAKRKKWNLAVNSNARVSNLTSLKNETFHYYFMRNRLIFSKKYHPNFNRVRYYYFQLLLKEVLQRVNRKKIKSYYKSRLLGFLNGILKTIY